MRTIGSDPTAATTSTSLCRNTPRDTVSQAAADRSATSGRAVSTKPHWFTTRTSRATKTSPGPEPPRRVQVRPGLRVGTRPGRSSGARGLRLRDAAQRHVDARRSRTRPRDRVPEPGHTVPSGQRQRCRVTPTEGNRTTYTWATGPNEAGIRAPSSRSPRPGPSPPSPTTRRFRLSRTRAPPRWRGRGTVRALRRAREARRTPAAHGDAHPRCVPPRRGAVRVAAPLGTHSSAGPARGGAANLCDVDRAPMAVRQQRCRRKTFTEALPSIPPRSRSTSRPRTSVGEAVADRGRTAVRATRGLEVPWPVANTAFTAAAEAAPPKDAPPVTHGRAGDGTSLKRQHPSSMGTACRGRRRRPVAAWLSSLRHRRRWRRRAARTAWW